MLSHGGHGVALVLVGCLPLDLLVEMEKEKCEYKVNKRLDYSCVDFNRKLNIYALDHIKLYYYMGKVPMKKGLMKIYIGGSRMEKRTGGAFVVYNEEN